MHTSLSVPSFLQNSDEDWLGAGKSWVKDFL